MHKIVINECYGGASLSREAVLLGRKIANNDTWCAGALKGDIDARYKTVTEHDYGSITVDRHDPILVQVVEQLGNRASGQCSNLAVKTITGPVYRIVDHDGFEQLSILPEDDGWHFVK